MRGWWKATKGLRWFMVWMVVVFSIAIAACSAVEEETTTTSTVPVSSRFVEIEIREFYRITCYILTTESDAAISCVNTR